MQGFTGRSSPGSPLSERTPTNNRKRGRSSNSPLQALEAPLEACPGCTASMRDGRLHCQNPDCIWLKCGKCGCTIDVETSTYNRGGTLWGNEHGYLKAS